MTLYILKKIGNYRLDIGIEAKVLKKQVRVWQELTVK